MLPVARTQVLLRTVGTMYQSMGEQYLGTREFSSAFSGLGASLRQSATSMGNKFDVARSVIGAVRQVGKMSKEVLLRASPLRRRCLGIAVIAALACRR